METFFMICNCSLILKRRHYQQMENQKSSSPFWIYQQELDKILGSPSFEVLAQFVSSDRSSLHEIVEGLEGSFVMRVQKDLVLCKQKVIECLHQGYSTLNEQELKIIKQKLRFLLMKNELFMKDGIISLFSELTQLKKQKQACRSLQMQVVLEKLLQTLEPIMRNHFILKQMKKLQQKIETSSLKQFISQKNIPLSETSLTLIQSNHSIKEFLSNSALNEISKNIECKSIQQLVSQQLLVEQKDISEGTQTCRICNIELKIKHLQSHLKFCAKIQESSSRRADIIEKQLELIEEMKKEIIRDNTIFQTDQDELGFESTKLLRHIINEFQKPKNPKVKRKSLLSCRNESEKTIVEQIDEYLVDNGQHELLTQYRQLFVERLYLEKKIRALEKNYATSIKENQYTQNSIQSSANISSLNNNTSCKSVKNNIKTKKSLFARKSERAEGSSRTQLQRITKFQSIKVHMDEIVTSNVDIEVETDSQADEEAQKAKKAHKSLTNFGKNGQKQVKQICIDDFDVIKFLGKGAFGKVYLVRRKKTKDIYALKLIKIRQNWDQKQIESLRNQHLILSKIAGEHLVKAPFSFTEGMAHFFVLQYMPGGDLSKLIEEQVYLEYEQAKFYLAEVVLAIERLHDFGIIHRDLKPENLIFDEDGHLRLTDFGLSEMRITDKIKKIKKMYSTFDGFTGKKDNQAKQNLQQQKKQVRRSVLLEAKNKVRLIGTPDYIAPEIINGESLDNLSIDWWSLGVIAYEMMIGCRPFCANTVDEIIDNISGLKIEWPQIGEQDDMIKPEVADFIKKLLNPNYLQRLGSKGVQEIKSHPFFAGICWDKIKKTSPPLMPAIDRKQKYQNSEQNQQLKQEIKTAMGDSKAKSSFKLQNFVRYDILVEQTLESADKQITKRQARIKKLRSIASNFDIASSESSQNLRPNSLEQLSDLENDQYYRLFEHKN